jgi:hypothetical protein
VVIFYLPSRCLAFVTKQATARLGRSLVGSPMMAAVQFYERVLIGICASSVAFLDFKTLTLGFKIVIKFF